MTEIPENAVDVPLRRVFCQVHGEPFRERWPMGYPTAAVMLLKSIIDNDQVIAAAQAIEKIGPDQKMNPKTLEQVLDRRAACCWVSTATLRETYRASGIGVLNRCRHCHRRGLGTPFQTANMGKLVHICFECVMARMQNRSN